MQPDKFTFLQSARRELLLAARELTGNSRAIYLNRAAQVMERLAFHEGGLGDLLPNAIERQNRLLERLLELNTGAVMQAPQGQENALDSYERNNVRMELLLGELASHRRMNEPAFAAKVDALFQDASQLAYDVTRAIAQQAQEQARLWEAGRPSCPAIDVTAERLTDYLRKRFPQYSGLKVTAVTKLTGLNANEAFFIGVEGHPDWPADLILRRTLPAHIQPFPITEEFAILEKVHGGPVPVPRPVFCEDSPDVLGEPFIALERLPGDVLPLPDMGERGKKVFLQLAAMMGRLHSLDPGMLPEFRRAKDGDARGWLLQRIEAYEKEWHRIAREPVHTVTAAFYWLRRHSDSFLREQVIVHGDMDHRNTLVGADDRILAIIDWEVSHQGHPAEDLAYAREHVERVMTWADFIAVYEANGGKKVTDEEMRYAKVLSNLLRVTTSMVAHLAYVDGVSDNFLMGSVRTIETETACQFLHEAIHGQCC